MGDVGRGAVRGLPAPHTQQQGRAAVVKLKGVFWGVVFSLPMWGGIAFAGYLVLGMLPGSVVPS